MSDRRTSIWILGDQLLARHPALAAAEEGHARDELQVVMIESKARARRLPYQAKKLVLLFSAMRHYAHYLREQGYSVDYIKAAIFLDGLRQHVTAWRPDHLFTMEASEWRGRRFERTGLADALAHPRRSYPIHSSW
jgi:deoxyribodipyrimidine photolyase-related protein